MKFIEKKDISSKNNIGIIRNLEIKFYAENCYNYNNITVIYIIYKKNPKHKFFNNFKNFLKFLFFKQKWFSNKDSKNKKMKKQTLLK
jgi:hypothetical protein